MPHHTASALEPESIVAWNNLAYALHAYGCESQARIALQCGLNIKPADKNLQDSLQELKGSSVSGSADCPLIQCY